MRPWLGVNVLSEFAFCPRAGLVELEKSRLFSSEEDLEPRANFLLMPLYDLAVIDEEISFRVGAALFLIPLVITAAIATTVSYERFGLAASFLGVCFCFLLSGILFRTVRPLPTLLSTRAYAKARSAREPDPRKADGVKIDWWEMIHAGFRATHYDEPFKDHELRLTGNPWRVLERDGVKIPVFKKRFNDGPSGRNLFPQHYARIAAYCRVLESSLGCESPYGIILFAGSFEGVAVSPSTFQARAALSEAMAVAHSTVIMHDYEQLPPEKPPPSFCKLCPLGNPFESYSSTNENGYPPNVVSVVGIDGRSYHSVCGDRFQWVPLHEKAFEKGLIKGLRSVS